jgi:hypothetical protein
MSELNKCVRLSKEVYDALTKNGAKGETYDDILRRLLRLN